MSQERRQRKADKNAVEAVEPGMKRLGIDVKPLRRQVCHDDREDARNCHLGHTSYVCPPGDRGQKENPR